MSSHFSKCLPNKVAWPHTCLSDLWKCVLGTILWIVLYVVFGWTYVLCTHDFHMIMIWISNVECKYLILMKYLVFVKACEYGILWMVIYAYMIEPSIYLLWMNSFIKGDFHMKSLKMSRRLAFKTLKWDLGFQTDFACKSSLSIRLGFGNLPHASERWVDEYGREYSRRVD